MDFNNKLYENSFHSLSMRRQGIKILGEYWRVVKGSFLKFCCFWTGKKLIILNFTLIQNIIFEKRATNLIRMHSIAFSTLKSTFGF